MPIGFLDSNTKMRGCFYEICKCQIAVTIRYPFHLIETSYGISDMVSISQGFFTQFWKCINTIWQFFSLFSIQFTVLYIGFPGCSSHNYLQFFKIALLMTILRRNEPDSSPTLFYP